MLCSTFLETIITIKLKPLRPRNKMAKWAVNSEREWNWEREQMVKESINEGKTWH